MIGLLANVTWRSLPSKLWRITVLAGIPRRPGKEAREQARE